MKVMLRTIEHNNLTYEALTFVCPGCKDMHPGNTGLHMLPINTEKKSPAWEFDGNLESPTLTPSILTRHHSGGVCHSFLKNGMLEFLQDCTHKYAGQTVPLFDLPDWVTQENEEKG